MALQSTSRAPSGAKADPLAALRAKIKAGDVKPPKPAAKTGLLGDNDLLTLYSRASQSKPAQIQHIAGLKAVYEAGISGLKTLPPA